MNFWDQRFSEPGYAYGKEPNEFLRQVAFKLPRGRCLSLAEGEGRNAVFLASLDHRVTAVDQSSVGLKKALALAVEKGVSIQVIHADLAEVEIEPNAWDVIISFYGHLPANLRIKTHAQIVKGLKSGGALVMESFGKGQLERGTGGPQTLEMLYHQEELEHDFAGLEFEISQTVVREISQGCHHGGQAEVIQLLAWKK